MNKGVARDNLSLHFGSAKVKLILIILVLKFKHVAHTSTSWKKAFFSDWSELV